MLQCQLHHYLGVTERCQDSHELVCVCEGGGGGREGGKQCSAIAQQEPACTAVTFQVSAGLMVCRGCVTSNIAICNKPEVQVRQLDP